MKDRSSRARSGIVLAFTAALVVATCSSVAGAADSTTTTAKPVAGGSSDVASRDKGKVDPNADKTFAYGSGPLGFDPIRTFAVPQNFATYDRLTQLDSALQVKPMLAKSWEFAPDGSTLTLTLRDDATFTDGTKIDAAAVKANLDRSRTAPFSNVRNSLTAIESIEAVDPTTVRITLAPGEGVSLPSLFAFQAGMMVNPKAIADPNVDLTQGPGAGNESGPYVIESATVGPLGEAQFVQRPDYDDYWDKKAGRIKRLKIMGIVTGAQRINAVRAGDVNLAQVTGTDVPQAAQLITSGELGGQLFNSVTSQQGVEMRATRPPLDNLKLRQAIKIALDKDAIAEGLYSGTCRPSSQDYPEGNFWHVDAIDKKTQYNEAKAKKLVEQSGVSNPTVSMVYGAIHQPQAEVVKDQLAKIGVTVDLVPATPGGPLFVNGDFDMAWAHLIETDPAATMGSTWMNDAAPLVPLIPEADWPEFTPLVEKLADPTQAPEVRKKVWSQIATKLDTNSYNVPVCNAAQVWVTDKSIGNVENMLNGWSGLVDFRYLYGIKS